MVLKKRTPTTLAELVTAMGLSRSGWVTRVMYVLEGALGEYAQVVYAQVVYARESGVGLDWVDKWEGEVVDHFRRLGKLLDPKITKTGSSFRRDKAFLEAMEDASGAIHQITSARNKLDSMVKSKARRRALYEVKIEPETLLPEMVAKFGKGLKISRKGS